MTPPKPKSPTLRHAVAVVFALTAVLPLLALTYTLYRLTGIRELQDQITLALALLAALLGFYVLRVMVTRVSALLRAVGEAAERGEIPTLAAEEDLQVPGVGTIHEFREVAKRVDFLWTIWKSEAELHVGRRVLVTVKNSPEPIAGTLVEVTDDGVLLEEDSQQVGVSYRRISAIEADGSASSRAR